ncbi:MAG: radical SAM protein [Proteobacteria bacterium]|nr:radical SAM protein [Pseudomonadota bacterium]MBU1583598.1 radical SAM protein [Pseudomonadota bacterium]MBU2452489.1 radical SAM protein [Pseudomonadota bacterium]MBU2629898.1 radical SAM protein [Pseudomonadota bacterium]
MKTLVLEHPRIASKKRFNDIANTPLWSCLMGGYAAAALECNGFHTTFLDHALPGALFDQTKKKILTLNPDLLCINTVYFWEHTPVFFEFLSDLKSSGFKGHINLFGFFPSLVYRQLLKANDQIDSIAVGEFEHTLPELAASLENGTSLETIEGLALKSCLIDNISRMRSPEKHPDIFAFPQRKRLDGTVTILGSRGCYNHCSFCPVPSFYNQGSLWQGRSPQNIAEEIKELVMQGVTQFYFCDPNFIGPGTKGKKRIIELMDLIKPMKIKFGMETRPQDLDDEILEKLVGAGFESLLMGVESGSTTVLKQIDKSSGPVQSSKAIELCRKHGIEPEIGFLMFVPDSGLYDLRENMNFLMKNKLLDHLARTANLLSHTQIVLAGTSGYHRFEKENRLNTSGIFGFEAEVTFSDPAVEWVTKRLTYACHTILKSMSNSHSPIYWKNEDNHISRAANEYLVQLGYNLIDQAEKDANNSHKKKDTHWKEEILTDIKSILKIK